MKIQCLFKTAALIFVFFLTSCSGELDMNEPGLLVPLTVMEDSSIPSITINGVKLHSETFGDPQDPILLMLHGGPGADYRSLLNFKELADEGLFVVFYDQMGSGLSQRLDESAYSAVQIYIDELDGVINHYKKDTEQKVLLAGHSWGAMLATAYVNQKPENIAGLILSEPGGFTWDQVSDYFSRSLQLQIGNEQTNDFVYQDQFITSDEHEALDYKLALASVASDTGDDPTQLPFWRYGAVCSSASLELAQANQADMDFTQNLANYPTKVLFAYSELNQAYGKEHAELVSAFYPSVNLVEISGCGHEIPHFGWENFRPLILEYLQEIM